MVVKFLKLQKMKMNYVFCSFFSFVQIGIPQCCTQYDPDTWNNTE